MRISESCIKIFFIMVIASLCAVSCVFYSNPVYYTHSNDYHIVQPGESLESIGKIYKISPEDLILYNNLKSSRIFPGQRIHLEPKLRLKQEFVTVRSIPKKGYHLVRSKETITRIAKMYDVALIEIMNINKLKTFNLKTGQKIYLKADVIKVETEEIKPEKTTIIPEEEIEKPAKEEVVIAEDKPIPKKTITPKKSDLILPLLGTVTSEFGMRDGKPHKGIDVAAEIGAPIHAAMSGKVVYVGTQRGYGNVIILEHENYVMTVYAHNETNLVRLDDIVNSGQPIATVGETGTTTGPHLHFEYRVQGRAVNPREIFPDF